MTNAGDFLHEMANKYEKLSKSDSVLSNIILLHVLHIMSKENSVCVHCKHTTPSKRDVWLLKITVKTRAYFFSAQKNAQKPQGIYPFSS